MNIYDNSSCVLLWLYRDQVKTYLFAPVCLPIEWIRLIKYVSTNLFTCLRQWGKYLLIANSDLSDHAFFSALRSISLSLSISPLTRLARITLTAAIYRNKVRIRVRPFWALFPLLTLSARYDVEEEIIRARCRWMPAKVGRLIVWDQQDYDWVDWRDDVGREGLSVRNGSAVFRKVYGRIN